jgi:hypothetical protein
MNPGRSSSLPSIGPRATFFWRSPQRQ